jgi:hypothetical protein
VSRRRGFSLGLNEQSAVGIAAVKLKLRWRELPFAYNYTMGSFLSKEKLLLQDTTSNARDTEVTPTS